MTLPNFSAVAIIASQSSSGRTRALVGHAVARLAALDVTTRRVDLGALPAEGLLGRAPSDRVSTAIEAVEQADIVIVGTPIYRASYSGLLKVFFDLLPQPALRSKVAVPLATGGSPAHLLAIDFALRPLLTSLGAVVTSRAVFADESQIDSGRIDAMLVDRVERAVDEALSLAVAVSPPAEERAALELVGA